MIFEKLLYRALTIKPVSSLVVAETENGKGRFRVLVGYSCNSCMLMKSMKTIA